MGNDEIFEKSTKEYGESLTNLGTTEKSDIENFEFILESYRSRNYFSDKSFKPIIGYIASPHLNAIAKLSDNNIPIIGICVGTRLIMFDLFQRLMSYNNILPNVGNISLEKIEEPTIRNYYRNANLFSEFAMLDYGKYKISVPNDKVRKNFGFFLTHLAMEFVFEHELAHHKNGHVLFLENDFNIRKISLFDDKGIANKSLETFQTLEMDADCSAIVRVSNRIIGVFNSEKFQSFKNEGGQLQFYDDIYETISYLMFSILNFFMVMDNDVIDNKSEYKYKHPPARLRALMVTSTLIENLKKNHPDIDLDLMKKKINQVFGEALSAKEKLTGIKLNKDIFKNEIYARHELPKQLLEHWEIIRPKLSSYSIVNLAP